MAIKLTLYGAELTFDTVAEYNEFARTNAAITDEGVAADEITTQEDEIKIGDKVEIIGNTHDYHRHKIGEIGVVTEIDDEDGDYKVNVNGFKNYVLKQDVKKVDSETKEGKRVPEGYERVSFVDAKEGDFFLALDDECDITAGNKYELREDYDGDLEFDDDVEDARMLENRDEDVDGIVIRKIAEDNTEDAPLKKGDVVTGIAGRRYVYTTDKALLQVTNVFDGKINVKILKSVDNPEEEGRKYDVYPEHFDRTTEEEFNAKHELSADKDDKADKYERISFEDAKVGDYWVADEESLDITVGKRYLIAKVYIDADGDIVVNFDNDEGDERERYHFSANGHIEREVSESKPKFKVGDKVRVAAASYHHLEDGCIAKILRVSESSTHIRNGKRTPTPYYVGHQFIAAEDLTLVTDDEVQTQDTSFEKGDRVVVTEEGVGDHYFKKGTVGTVIDYSRGSGRPYVQADSVNAWIEDSEYAKKDDNAQYISEGILEAFTSKHVEVGAKYEVIERAERYSAGRFVEKGVIIKVTDVLPDGDIHIENVDGSESGMLILAKEAHKLRKVEEKVEVQTQELVFERGDVVRMTEDVTDYYDDKIKEGRLAVVDWLPSDRTEIAVKQREGKSVVIVPKSAVELVAKAIK
ncbi:hypothetical protein LAU42_09115 [Macrococcus armenti]|uniref:hypothetical protein n=1 Tax=Macrococcus armenti TaxID=2875764 RepID=UPI001CCB5E98|nr:hypothetical protein [Macrococcus armenti]UBH21924.1 hypothetical protein LAU42_09115 [Macrococcus armenti]